MSKRQADHTVSDIIRLAPKWFSDKQTDKDKAVAYLQHILTLMEAGNHHFANYYFHDVFDTYNISAFPIQEINKLLMEHRHETRRTLPIPTSITTVTKLALIAPDDLRKAVKPSTQLIINEIENTKYQIKEFEGYIRDYERNLSEARRNIHDTLINLSRMEATMIGLEIKKEQGVGQVDPEKMRLLRSIPSQWLVTYMDEEHFAIIRKTPITIAHINAGSGMCKTLYLGYMGLRFQWNMGCIGSFHVADYINHNSSRVHPHVSGSHICFGNVQRRAETLISERNYEKYFELLETVLTTFSPEGPYITWSDLERSKTTKYTAFNIAPSNLPWWKDKRSQMIAAIRPTASDSFEEWCLKNPSIVTGSTAAIYEESTMNLKQRRFFDYCERQTRKMFGDMRNSIETEIHSISPQGVRGGALLAVIRKLIPDFRLPEQNEFFRLGFTKSQLPAKMVQLMCLVYRTVPVVDGSVQIEGISYPDRFYHMTDIVSTSFVVRPHDAGKVGERVACPHVSFYTVTPIKPLDMIDQIFGGPYQTAPTITVSSPEPEEETYCTHDEHNDNGYCIECDEYDEVYDTRAQEEEHDEEEEHEDAPF